MSDETYRVVLDTNQVLSAGTSWMERGQPQPDPNTCRRLLIRVAEVHRGLYCGKIIGEYLEKLVDLKHPPERAWKLIAYLMGAFTPVAITTRSAPISPTDADDEIFLLCALDGNADFLVTDDGSLITLKASYTRPLIGTSAELAPRLGA